MAENKIACEVLEKRELGLHGLHVLGVHPAALRSGWILTLPAEPCSSPVGLVLEAISGFDDDLL